MDLIFVITDDEEARKKISSECGKVHIFDCPSWYFKSNITGDKMISYPAEQIDANIYVQLFATAPFLKSKTINKSISILENDKQYDSVFTVIEKHDWVWYKNKPITYTPGNLPRSQDAVPLMIESTGLYAINKAALRSLKRRVGDKPYMLKVNEIEGLDIDTTFDFFMAEIIMKNIIKVNEFIEKEDANF